MHMYIYIYCVCILFIMTMHWIVVNYYHFYSLILDHDKIIGKMDNDIFLHNR